MSFIIHGARQTLSVFADEFTNNIGPLFASFGIALGGLIVGGILIKIGECCTGASSNRRWYKTQTNKWKEKTRSSKQSVIRLITMSLSILITTVAFWIAAQTAGFNFWTVVLGYGILSLIGTYAFGQMLRDIGAFFLVSLTDKIEEGNWIEVGGMGVEGRITAIHWLWVEVAYNDPKTGQVEEAQIPTGFIMMNVIKRKFSREVEVIRGPDGDVYESTIPEKTGQRVSMSGLRKNKILEV